MNLAIELSQGYSLELEKSVKDSVLASVSLETRNSLETKRSVISSVSLLESKRAWWKLCYGADIPPFHNPKSNCIHNGLSISVITVIAIWHRIEEFPNR